MFVSTMFALYVRLKQEQKIPLEKCAVSTLALLYYETIHHRPEPIKSRRENHYQGPKSTFFSLSDSRLSSQLV